MMFGILISNKFEILSKSHVTVIFLIGLTWNNFDYLQINRYRNEVCAYYIHVQVIYFIFINIDANI